MSTDEISTTAAEPVGGKESCVVLKIPEKIADHDEVYQCSLLTSSHDGRIIPPNGKEVAVEEREYCKEYTKTVTLNATPQQKVMEGSEMLTAPQGDVDQSSSFCAVNIASTNVSGTNSSDPPPLIDEGAEEEAKSVVSCGNDFPPIKCNSSRLQTEVESYSSSTFGSLTVTPPTTTLRLPINIIPVTGSFPSLSNYNLLLTKNVEFFQVLAKRTDSNVQPSKVGLRCTHCASLPDHYPAASFFPSAVSSIASGMGTIATRHFIGGRCPLLPKTVINELIIAKKNSTMQTKTAGHIGMEAYTRNICTQFGIVNAAGGGVQFLPVEHTSELQSDKSDQGQLNMRLDKGCDTNQVLNEVSNQDVVQKQEESISTIENSVTTHASGSAKFVFQKTSIDHFWECKECASVPLYWRASGSILFSFSEPSEEEVAKHRKVCKGPERLTVPRNSVAALSQDDNSYIVRIKWDSTNFCEYNSYDDHSFDYDCKDSSLIPASLVSSKEKVLTTDFAFFSMQQLFACHLTRSGGSRGALPVGYPGLACKHCAGEPNERRFFYTSAEHLRNSFSHIPSHLMECTKCSGEIKATLAAFRKDRSRQKSLLKAGSHKFFIESVWARVHKKRKESSTLESMEENKMSCFKPKQKKPKVVDPSEQKSCFTEGTTSPIALSRQLCVQEDNSLTTDFTFFTTMQLIKCRLERGCGSRPSCPVGFPGLACRHCFGKDGERRFFYTSADHLRNSFSHIPTHLMECKHCPSQVKESLVALKEIRHKQKSELRSGSHKSFINQIWDRVHAEHEQKRNEASFSSSSNGNQGTLVGLGAPPFLSSDCGGDKENRANAVELLDPRDKEMTSSYVYYILEQVKPYFLTEQEQGRGDFVVGYPGLVCIHCESQPNARKFFNRAFSQFFNGFSAISSHLSMCGCASKEVKDVLSSLKLLKPREDAKLKRGWHRLFMERVWARLMILGGDLTSFDLPRLTSTQQMSSTMSPCQPLDQGVSLPARIAMSAPLLAPHSFPMQVDALQTSGNESSTSLVIDSDKPFVTDFTFLTFMQVARCNLNDIGNGSRSAFDIGFPGLVCKHCATQPGARKFFYRTAEILAANYAHIPNHLLCCPRVPQDIKLDLEEKKKLHAEQKKTLQRGSQKEFFKCIMERMKGFNYKMIDKAA